jgi:hypothetical protein
MVNQMGFYLARSQVLNERDDMDDFARKGQYGTSSANFPEVQTIFNDSTDHPNAFLYNSAVVSALKRLMPVGEAMEEVSFKVLKEQWAEFCSTFPLFRWVVWDPVTLNVSIFLVSNFRISAGKFFYEMIHRWLLPGKKVNISLFFAIDFRIPDFDDQIYTLGEIVVHLNDIAEFEQALRNLPILETEIRLGVSSVYHAAKILEIKGLAVDEKTALIQERISSLLHHRPNDFDSDIFIQMQHFLIAGRSEFKAPREVRQMVRLIGYFYLMRREIKHRMELLPEKRHLKIKVGLTRLQLPFGSKRVLGVLVALNFLKDNEVFEDRYLLEAIQYFIPVIELVPDSVFIEHRKEEKIIAMYLEVTKNNGMEFHGEEIRLLRRELSEDLKKRVQQLTRPVFMPRNEEEVMKNIVVLSQELRYLRDIPQVIISFDEHTDSDISFTVIILRILLPHANSIQELFEKASTAYPFSIDRIKRVGTVWRKYPKEASVLRIRLPADSFVRSDHSLDLFRARQVVLGELKRVMGEVRDYNGGMISRQIEVFEKLQKALGEAAKQKELLLENFFHSISPVEQRGLLDPECIKNLFLLFLNLIDKGPSTDGKAEMVVEEENKILYAILNSEDLSIKNRVFHRLEPLGIPSGLLTSVAIQMVDTLYLGFIYFTEDLDAREVFVETLKESL